MPQVDFGSLYKFVASVGLALLVAALGVPWIVTQSIGVLLVSQETLDELPPSAAEAVQRRQALAAWAHDQFLGPFAVVAGLAGTALLIWALVKWAPSQKVADESERLALQSGEVQFQKLTKDEREDKLVAEATGGDPQPIEAVGELALTGTANAEAIPAPVNAAGAPPLDDAMAVRRAKTEEIIAEMRAVEDQVSALIEVAYGAAFEVTRDVKITSGVARNRRLDLLLDPRDGGWAQLGVEIRRFLGQLAPTRINEMVASTAMTTQDLSRGKVFTGTPGRPRDARASGVLILTLPAEGFENNAFRISRHVPIVNSVMNRPVGIVLLSDNRLAGVSAEDLRDAVSQAWADPDRVSRLD